MKNHHWMLASVALAVGVSFAATEAFAAAAQRTEAHECKLKYSKKEVSVPSKELDACLSAFMNRKDDVEQLNLVAGTLAAGKHQANVKRAGQRLANLKTKLSSEFPNARIETLNVGPSKEIGESVRLTVIAVTREVKAAMTEEKDERIPVTTEERRLHTSAGVGTESSEPQIEPQKEARELPRVSVAPTSVKAEMPRENFGRVAARLGQDSDRDLDESFPAIGLEVAYVRPNTGVPNLRTEMGGTAASMSKGDNLMKQASAHALLGAGWNMSGIIIGARALGGGVWDEENKWRDDFGGEGRLGFENKTVSIFAGVGRTQKTSRFGLDVGILL
jgi:hypothetical protein